MNKLHIAFALILTLPACTTELQTQHIKNSGEPVRGDIYILPMAIFDVEAKVVVTSCIVTGANNASFDYELVEGTIRNSYVADPEETYSFDYSELNSIMKTTTASTTHHSNGMIKTVNADVDDRTTQVLSTVGGAVLNLYKSAALGFAPMGATVASTCDKFILDKLSERKDLLEHKIPQASVADAALAKSNKEANDIAVNIEETKAHLAAAQKEKNQADINKHTAQLSSLQAKLAVSLSKLGGRVEQLPSLKAKLATVTNSLTITLKESGWAPKGTGTEICTSTKTQQNAFLTRLARLENAKIVKNAAPNDEFSVDICVTPMMIPPAPKTATTSTTDPSIYSGIVYRMPANGKVFIRNTIHPEERIDASQTISLPQFGTKGVVWLSNHVFDKNNVKISFNEDGSMNELSFGAASSAERAAAALSDSSKQLFDLVQLRADAIKAKETAKDEEVKAIQQKKLDDIDAQIALIGKLNALETAKRPSKDSYDIEKERLKNEIDLEKLRQELDGLRAQGGLQ